MLVKNGLMSINDYADIANKFTGTQPEHAPTVDRTEQVQVGLDFAKRQAEKPTVVEPKIPTMGGYPVAN